MPLRSNRDATARAVGARARRHASRARDGDGDDDGFRLWGGRNAREGERVSRDGDARRRGVSRAPAIGTRRPGARAGTRASHDARTIGARYRGGVGRRGGGVRARGGRGVRGEDAGEERRGGGARVRARRGGRGDGAVRGGGGRGGGEG